MSQDDDHPVELADDLDHERIAEAALGLLWLSLHDHTRVWKGMNWDVMNLLFRKGWIQDPIGKTRSVSLTPEGTERAEGYLYKHFGKK